MTVVAETLSQVALGLPASRLNLSLAPLLWPGAGEPGYLTLGRALRAGLVEITEISAAGAVGTLRATNRGDRPVLVLDGEELVGARQNRIANQTVLIAARSTVLLPVSCVEQGRWSWRSRSFTASRQTIHAEARRRQIRRVHESLRREGSWRGNQGEVWQAVADKGRRPRVRSRILALHDIYARHDARLAAYESEFEAARDQVGALFAVNGEFLGLELFDAPATFGELQSRLIRSYALDALERDRESGALADPSAAAAEDFLAALASVPENRFPGVRLGEAVRLDGETVTGAGLVHEGRHVHLVAFVH